MHGGSDRVEGKGGERYGSPCRQVGGGLWCGGVGEHPCVQRTRRMFFVVLGGDGGGSAPPPPLATPTGAERLRGGSFCLGVRMGDKAKDNAASGAAPFSPQCSDGLWKSSSQLTC